MFKKYGHFKSNLKKIKFDNTDGYFENFEIVEGNINGFKIKCEMRIDNKNKLLIIKPIDVSKYLEYGVK